MRTFSTQNTVLELVSYGMNHLSGVLKHYDGNTTDLLGIYIIHSTCRDRKLERGMLLM